MERWQQKEFYISTFDPFKHDATPEEAEQLIRWTKEANFNLVEFTWRNRAEVTVGVEACEKVGMPTLVQDPTFGGIGDDDRHATEETVREALEYYGKYEHILGYYVWDEPAASVFKPCRALTDLFRRLAPDKLAFSVVFPSYGVYTWASSDMDWKNNGYVKYIDGYLETVDPDVFSMDYYVFQMNKGIREVRYYDLWRDLGYCRRRALELGKPQWFYYQGIGDFAPVDGDCLADMTPEKLMVQMYAALSYGVKQLSCFTSVGLIIRDTEKTELFDAVKEINRRVLNVGNELLDKTPVAIYHTGIDDAYVEPYFLDRLEEDAVIASAGDELILGRLMKDDAQYLMVTNQRFVEENSGIIALRTPARIWEYDEDKAVYVDRGVGDTVTYALTPGHGRLYRLTAV